MKRRSFLQAVGGAIAAVLAPVVAAEQVKRLAVFPAPRLAMSLQEYNRVRPRFIFEPETVAELRAAIESRYETVHEFKEAPYEENSLGYGIGRAPTAQPPGYTGPFYRNVAIYGEGAGEKEAVADAFRHIGVAIAGREMMWRVPPALSGHHDFASERAWVSVYARLVVLR